MHNQTKRIRLYRVSRSVNPTRRANAEHTRVSSGPVPLYDYSKGMDYLNVSYAGEIGKYRRIGL